MKSNSPSAPGSKDRGFYYEQVAERHLHSAGLSTLARNYHCRLGEIDLIMQDKSTIVFVEVKFRSSNQFGGALGAVTASKQKKLIATAHHYLQHLASKHSNLACRFDIIAIEGEPAQITWLKNAIETTG